MKAKQRQRPVTVADLFAIENAIDYLQTARTSLRRSNAGNAANYVARALKSADGALRHAQSMYLRQETGDCGHEGHPMKRNERKPDNRCSDEHGPCDCDIAAGCAKGYNVNGGPCACACKDWKHKADCTLRKKLYGQ